MNYQLLLGDCLEVMRGLEAGSVDAIITDLPYGARATYYAERVRAKAAGAQEPQP